MSHFSTTTKGPASPSQTIPVQVLSAVLSLAALFLTSCSLPNQVGGLPRISRQEAVAAVAECANEGIQVWAWPKNARDRFANQRVARVQLFRVEGNQLAYQLFRHVTVSTERLGNIYRSSFREELIATERLDLAGVATVHYNQRGNWFFLVLRDAGGRVLLRLFAGNSLPGARLRHLAQAFMTLCPNARPGPSESRLHD
ncbi:hypothetical protein [Prosthecobacter sp.]|uniref:hypothetical protein n=1 Tax=Prosthecobacter sp. TaxID=1965333 RepID=UPI0037850F4A